MTCCELANIFVKDASDNIPQIISVVGTLLGTILGWLLKYLQENLGNTEFFIEEIKSYKTHNNEYAQNIKLLICNHSLKPKYISSLNILFKNKSQTIIESDARCNNDINSFLSLSNKDKINIINLKYNEPCNIIISSIVTKVDYDKLNDANAIFLTYKNMKGKLKELKITDNFLIENVESYTEGKSFL